ncbi:MAG TPA: hypothetical protein VGP08_25725 [Pyrinomonadaceae bacterium]|jgi:hypothetical protein|nr:hypothetical protein [Pyrinomonadaceae bacterium]
MKNPEIPLHLCQVLEEEFETLHGDAADAPSDAPRDWLFHEGHVDARGLAAALREAKAGWENSHPGRQPLPPGKPPRNERDLRVYLAFKYPDLLDGESETYHETLNRVLLEKNTQENSTFKKYRFERLALREETRDLLELGWEGKEITFSPSESRLRARGRGRKKERAEASVPEPKSDLVRFRRLLLQDALPDYLKGVYDVRLSKIVAEIHALPAPRTALCLSGGGIRSGTFALGVIQSLAGRGMLGQFDYLSTVSGGGYIGGWLTAWIHRHPNGLLGVVKDLSPGARASKVEPEPEPLRHLRDYSSFITPRTGLLSADSWTFIVIYLRNLLLNWVVLIPLFASLLLVPRVSVAVVVAEPTWELLAMLLLLGALGVVLLKPSLLRARGTQLVLLAALLLVPLAVIGVSDLYVNGRGWNVSSALLVAGTLLGGYSIAYMRLNRPSNTGVIRPGSFWAKHGGQDSFLWLCLLPLCISGTLLTTFWAWFRHTAGNADPMHVLFLGLRLSELGGFLVYGALLGVTGWLLYLILARTLKGAAREFLVTLLASLIAALLLYALAVNVPYFYSPVVDALGKGDVVRSYTIWRGAEIYAVFAFPTYMLLFFLGLTLFVGLTSRRSEYSPKERREPDARKVASKKWGPARINFETPHVYDTCFIEDEDREWLARASAWFVISAAGWLFFAGLVVFGPLLLFRFENLLPAVGGVSGLISVLGGSSSGSPGSKKPGKLDILKTLGVNVIVLASFVFFACIVILVSLLTGTLVAWLAKYLPAVATGPHLEMFRERYPFSSVANVYRVTHFPAWYYLFGLALALQIFGRVGSRVINLNKFSLHAGYRDRIIRAFLGASRLKNERHENPFTGFDPRDNLYMPELRPWQLRESDFKEPGGLAAFVAHLGGKAPENRDGKDAEGLAQRADAAKYLRGEIERIKGDAREYLKDPPQSINTNPSFRSALFGDLSRILQLSPLDKAEQFKPYVESAREEYRRLVPARADAEQRVLLNRLLLLRAFPDCLKYPPRLYSLMHVVNMALNLVGGDRLAWQQRRAESFTATPLHSGSLFVGYRPTSDYGGNSGIALGTAVAISGAAASSNMGYFSPSPFVTLVLTFFNARLGWWLGNPGVHGSETFFRSHPKKALSPIIDEAFGLTDDTNPYVLLSDGGHFENLGLYEMVLRRCRYIFVVDGSADPSGSYDDLGGAVRKIRVDFGIDIEFKKEFKILSRPESLDKKGGAYCAVGDIHYERVDGDAAGEPGKLVYIKPAVYGDEPRDVFNYTKGHEDFPHESTADQFFDEPQFESHRMLGFHILEKLYEESREPVTLEGFVTGLDPDPDSQEKPLTT